MKKRNLFIVIIILIVGLCYVYFNKSESDTTIVTSKNPKTSSIEKSIEDGILEEDKLTKENCDYETTDEGNIKLTNYVGELDSVIIPKGMDGRVIEEIDSDIFKYNDNLEMVKLPVEMEDKVDEIINFEINEDLSDSEYIVYTSMKEYNENYLKYIELSKSEKQKMEIVPSKFEAPIEAVYSEEMQQLYDVDENEIPSKYDLRDKIEIGVEDQNPLENCYAYAILTSVETNLALRHNVLKDFSEIHLSSLMTGGMMGSNGWYVGNDYFRDGYRTCG